MRISRNKVDYSFFGTSNENDEVVLSMNGLNFVKVRYGMSELRLLVDTGASLSIIFRSSLTGDEWVDESTKIKIAGIAGTTYTVGTADIDIEVGKEVLTHKFHVMNECECEMDGVIGADFLAKHGAMIDYENFLLYLNNGTGRICVSLESKFNKITKIPSRCETIQYVEIECEEECVILPEEVCKGVFVASGVVKPGKSKEVPIRILNTNESEVILRNFRPKVDKFVNYECVAFEEVPLSVKRVDEVLGQIRYDMLTSEEKTDIEKICAKYADVFYLEGDQCTVTNVYKQAIKIKDGTAPTYIKPYRLPYSQKTEIGRQVNKMLEQGLIEPASSEWSAPLLIVLKKCDPTGNKKWRIVIDYRQLN